ncbi:uncharacterized protein EI90DRAFT_3069936 [Cantharellus anzutake]|uniref:uncharacterized protein n=1 Tax=Cantharellus anzutake TaxID=1750568 RepID=UPI0019041162|nr:uncharacterized protein EI90DRAFT_3069936 [Cantharellus anzutake]KAF8326616.1 hypothetical protein EI90DRAFT_3069936 [Cantharellus anzutake]
MSIAELACMGTWAQQGFGRARGADDSGDDMPAISRQEALQAALLLMTHTKQIHSSFAWKMEVILGQFRCKTHHQVQSLLRSSTLDSCFKKVV